MDKNTDPNTGWFIKCDDCQQIRYSNLTYEEMLDSLGVTCQVCGSVMMNEAHIESVKKTKVIRDAILALNALFKKFLPNAKEKEYNFHYEDNQIILEEKGE